MSDSELNDFLEFLEYEESVNDTVPRRYLRDQENPLEFFNECQFKRRFRFNKETVVNRLIQLFQDNNSTERRGLPLPPMLKLCTALRYYATGSFQVVSADLNRISQASVCRIIQHTSEILARNVMRFIKFPNSIAAFNKIKQDFYTKAQFPGVIGLVDGTHIPIKSPGGVRAEVFRNRKGYFSVNVQIISGPNEEILNIVVRWPGSAHDARIFDNCSVRVQLEDGQLPGHLLGDSGYPQRLYIYTPVSNPRSQAELNYNKSHKVTRSQVERTIGRWKRRFPCLYNEMQLKLKNITRTITACAVLYNIGINASDTWDDLDNDEGNRINEIPALPLTGTSRGTMIRNVFIERHFN